MGTKTIFFIQRHNLPADSKVIYENFICDVRLIKKETHRGRLTVSGDKLDYCGDPSSPAVSLLDIKIFVNSVISDTQKYDRYDIADIKYYYLNNPIKTYQYMKIPLRFFTPEICKEYDITNLPHNGFVYVKIRKDMYRLKESGIITFKIFVYNLEPHGYHPVKHAPGLWRHKDCNIMFTLAVDDFDIKYFHM